MRLILTACLLSLTVSDIALGQSLTSAQIQTMIDNATGERDIGGNGTVIIPNATHVLTTPLTIRQGIHFGGSVNPGTTAGFQATLVWAGPSDVPMITLDGSGKNGTTLYAGTGGEISKLLILRRGQGGTAILIKAKSADQRPGELLLDRLLIFGENGSQAWDDGIVVDGSASPGTNTSGVRRVELRGCRIAHCKANHYHFKSAVSMSASACQADPGGTIPRAMVRFSGTCYDCSMDKLNVNGDILIEDDGTSPLNFSFFGKVSLLRIENPKATGVYAITTHAAPINAAAKFRGIAGGY